MTGESPAALRWSMTLGLKVDGLVTVAVIMCLVLPSCGGNAARGEDPLVSRYKQEFETTRQAMLATVQEWNQCGADRAECRSVLNRIEILTTSFGNLYWDFSIDGKQQQIPVPQCLAQADAEVTQAVAGFRRGTAAGFHVYDDGLPQFLRSAVDSINEATGRMEAAEALIRSVHCGVTNHSQTSDSVVVNPVFS